MYPIGRLDPTSGTVGLVRPTPGDHLDGRTDELVDTSDAVLDETQVVLTEHSPTNEYDDGRRLDSCLYGVDDMGTTPFSDWSWVGGMPLANQSIQLAGRETPGPVLDDNIEGLAKPV